MTAWRYKISLKQKTKTLGEHAYRQQNGTKKLTRFIIEKSNITLQDKRKKDLNESLLFYKLNFRRSTDNRPDSNKTRVNFDGVCACEIMH